MITQFPKLGGNSRIVVGFFQSLLLVLTVGIEHAVGWPVLSIAMFAILVWSLPVALQVYASLVWGWYLGIMYGINPGVSMGLFLLASFVFEYITRWWQHVPTRFMIAFSLITGAFIVMTSTSSTSLAVGHAFLSILFVAWMSFRRRSTTTRLKITEALKKSN